MKLVKRDGIYYVMGSWRGQRIRLSTKTGDPDAAKVVFDQVVRETVEGRRPDGRRTFDEAAKAYLGKPGRNYSTSYVVGVSWIASLFEGVKLADMTPALVEKKLAAAYPEGAGAGTYRRRYADVRAVLRYAQNNGWIERVPRFDMPPMPEGRDVFLTREQVRRLLDAANGRESHIGQLALFCVATGARPGEAMKLRWNDVAPDYGHVVLRTRKRRGGAEAKRYVDLAKPVRSMLETLPREHEHVFVTARGTPWKADNHSYKGSWARLVEAAGLPKGVQMRDLRRTFASHLVRETGNLLAVRDVLGHADLTMLSKVYGRLLPSDRREATLAIEKVVGE